MQDLPIPESALADCGAILGRRGAGKSGTGRSLLEHELAAGHRCCVIDPKGDWWGLRMLADGSPSTFPIPVFGGRHGDIELTEEMGTELGKTIATHDLSCLVDISDFPSQASMRRFMLSFAQSLYRHNRAPLTLFVDEADQLAPQKVPADMAKLLDAMEKLIRLGRQRGIFMWMLTQRPQILNKNLLSQAETLIAMRMTTPHDRKAIKEWMEAHDPDEAVRVMRALSKLAVGEAFVWAPAEDFLQRVQFPKFTTYDSGRTPKHGEKLADVALPQIELSTVLESLADTWRAEAEAPADATELESLRAELVSVKRTLMARDKELEVARSRISKARAALGLKDEEPVVIPSEPPRQVTHTDARNSLNLGAERKPLAALAAVYPSGMSEAAWAVAAGFKRSGGTWSTYKSRLKKADLIVQEGILWRATQKGAESVGETELPPAPGPELVRWWANKLKSVTPMAEALIDAYPSWLSREELAERIGMTASGGSFSTYISRLSTPGLVERDRDRGIRLSPSVMQS